MKSLNDLVRTRIVDFFNKNNELLFNERDLQMHLAIELCKHETDFDGIDVEYYVPNHELKDYTHDNGVRIDIVVMKDGEYCPVELKYKTNKFERKLSHFDEILTKDADILKNQDAHNTSMYDFWKDVLRLELVKTRFKNVKGGLAVFVTNDPRYTKEPKQTSNHYCFRMNEGRHSTNKQWKNENSRCAENRPSFTVNKEYVIEWHEFTLEDIKLPVG